MIEMNFEQAVESWKLLKGTRVRVRMKSGAVMEGEVTDWAEYWDKNATADTAWRSKHLALKQSRTTVALEIEKVRGWDPVRE